MYVGIHTPEGGGEGRPILVRSTREAAVNRAQEIVNRLSGSVQIWKTYEDTNNAPHPEGGPITKGNENGNQE